MSALANLTLPKVKAKYVLLEIFAFLNMTDCLERLWEVSLTGRGYIVKNYREINNVLLKYVTTKKIDLSKSERLIYAFNLISESMGNSQTRIHLIVPSI